MWSLVNKSINTMDVLQCRLQNSYEMYNKKSEYDKHLFLYCNAGVFLWDTLQQKIRDSIPKDSLSSLGYFLNKLNDSNMQIKIIFNCIVAILWSLWIKRNSRTFTSIYNPNSLKTLQKDYCNLIGLWCSRHNIFKNYTSNTIVLNFNALCN